LQIFIRILFSDLALVQSISLFVETHVRKLQNHCAKQSESSEGEADTKAGGISWLLVVEELLLC
jgi:hypothetical protein